MHTAQSEKVRGNAEKGVQQEGGGRGLLDIFYDGEDVFVDLQLKFPDKDSEKNYLLYANNMVEFFEALAESGLILFAPTLQHIQIRRTCS